NKTDDAVPASQPVVQPQTTKQRIVTAFSNPKTSFVTGIALTVIACYAKGC
ncbi:MAG: hypothetical protein KR126chlam6_00181, partial [Candidatus Anoxychlamydiales bacterium]|nr:hypothetical protein [Candidatus Anoxychlamydiales bacterium]